MIMSYKIIFQDILNAIAPSTINGALKEICSKACHEIQGKAIKAGHPFFMFDDWCIYCYTGKCWERISDIDLKAFLKEAYCKICGNTVQASQREVIEGLFKQFPYTVLSSGTTQAKDKVNFLNCTLDLNTEKPMPHSYYDYFRYVLPYAYNPNARCPMFMKYLDEVLPEKDAQNVLAEYIGWIFLPDLKLEKVLFLYGAGCNGKSVFVDIIEALLGRDNVSHESLSDMCGDSGDRSRANLAGKLLNTCSDVSPNAFSGDIFKRIASGEPISTRLLYKDVVTLTGYAKMMFCLNELPKTKDNSKGYFRRFLIVPFNVQIPKSRIDPKLAQKIISTELPGIMNWALEGRARLVRQQGFSDSPICDRELEKYRSGYTKSKSPLILPIGFQR